MRRRLLQFLPVMAFALAVQLLAPVASCWANAIAASDPLAGAVLCVNAKADHADSKGAMPRARDGACHACCVPHPAAPPEPFQITTIAPRTVTPVIWRAFQSDAVAVWLSAHARARAPPALS